MKYLILTMIISNVLVIWAMIKAPYYDEATNKFYYKNKKNEKDRKSTRLNSSHIPLSRMPSSA